MIHLFESLGKRMALDVGSGAVLSLDPIAYDALAALVEDPAALPLCTTANVRFYTDCGAVVVQDAATGKYALYVNGERHYDYVYDSILPVESDVRWQGDILPGSAGQAMVLTVSGASYPQPLSHYFVLTRGATEEYVALSAVTNCPILLD